MAEPGPAPLPAGLRQDWPAPWRPVWGDRGGALATLEALLALGTLKGLGYLPRPLLDALVGAGARAARRLDRRHSDAARRFLEQAFGPLPAGELEERVLTAWRHFLRITVDSEAFMRHVPTERMLDHYELELSPEVERVRAAGRGALLVGGHIGDWEAGSALMPRIGFDPFYAFSRPPRNRPLSQAVQRSRERRGVRLLPRRGGMSDARRIVQAGGAIGLLLDQRAREKPVLAPFFGRPARCDRAAAVLIKRLRIPILVAACFVLPPERFRYRFVLRTVLWPDELAGAEIEEVVARVNAEIEALVRERPEQYFWLHDRYRKTPLEMPGAEAEDVPEHGDAAAEIGRDSGASNG